MLEQAPRKDPPTAGATPATLAGLLRSWVRVWGSLGEAVGLSQLGEAFLEGSGCRGASLRMD